MIDTTRLIDESPCPECENDFMFLVHGDADVVVCTACYHLFTGTPELLALIDDMDSGLPETERNFWKEFAAGLVVPS